MSKTVDELIGVYIEASNAVVWEAEKRGLCPMTLDMQRAGIAAVVSELMEHFVTGASTYAWDADDLHAEFMKILGAAGDEAAAACATSQTEGEVHDGRISQSLSPTRRGRSEVAGPLEGSGNGAARDDQRSGTHPRAVAREDQAGRGRHVGGEGHHCLNEKVAGGSTREDEKAVEAAGDKGPVTVNSPATAPAPVGVAKMQTLLRKWRETYDKGVKDMRATDPCPRCGYPAQDQCDSPDCNTSPPPMCEWVEQTHPRTGNWWKRCDGELRRVASREGRSCMVCKRPIKFTEAKT